MTLLSIIVNYINNNIFFIFFFISIAFMVINGINVIKFSTKKVPNLLRFLRYIINLITLSVYTYMLGHLPGSNLGHNGLELNNLIGIIFILFLLQFSRIYFDSFENRVARGFFTINANLRKNVLDLLSNIVIFTGMYLSILYCRNQYFLIIGYLLCALNIIRVIKYRLIDDILKRALWKGGYIGTRSNPVGTLYQGLFNILPRTYFYIVMSFAVTYILLMNANYPLINANYPQHNQLFNIKEISGNIFVDFVYFSIVTISTVGFGDIVPIGVIPKILCAIEIAFGYFIILLFSLIISIYVSSVTNERKRRPSSRERFKNRI